MPPKTKTPAKAPAKAPAKKAAPRKRTPARKAAPSSTSAPAANPDVPMDPAHAAAVQRVVSAQPGDRLILVTSGDLNWQTAASMHDMLAVQHPGAQFTVLLGDLGLQPEAMFVDRAAQALHEASQQVQYPANPDARTEWRDVDGEAKVNLAETVRVWLATLPAMAR